jgi:DNA-binding response OmpR family regulator
VFLGEPDVALQARMRAELRNDAYDVQTFDNGAQLVEAAILQPPAAIAMRLEMKEQSADVVVGLLRGMSRTASVPLIVYGISAPDAQIEHVAGLDESQCTMLATADPAKLRVAVNRIFGR